MTTQAVEQEAFNEYSRILEPGFSASDYANELLKSTNNIDPSSVDEHNEDNELDIATAMKKVKFSIKDIGNKIQRISSTNYESLMDEFEGIEKFQDNFSNSIQSSLSELTQLMDTLDSEFLQNYEKCVKASRRLENIQATYFLMNELLFFLDVLKKFSTAFKSMPFDTSFEDDDGISSKSVDGVKKALKKAGAQFYILNKIIHDNDAKDKNKTDLFKQIKLIKTFNKSYKIDKIDKINNYCLNIMKSDNLLWHEKTSGDTSEPLIQIIIITLAIFNTNDSFIEAFNKFYKDELNNCITLLRKSLVSPKNFDDIMVKVSHKSRKIIQIIEALSSLRVMSYNHHLTESPYTFSVIEEKEANIGRSKNATSDSLNLNVFVLRNMDISLNNNSLFTNFYKDMSVEFEKMVSRTLVKGGPVAKNLKANQAKIQSSIKARILENDCDFYKVDAKSLEIVMMCNAVKK